MANVFAILTAIVLAFSAFLGYKNWEAYKVQIADRQEMQRKLATNQETLAKTIKKRDDTKAERESTEQDAAQKEQDLAAAEQKNKELQAQIETNQSKIAENKTKIEDIENRLKEAGDIPSLVNEMKTLSRQIDQLKSDIQQAEADLANLTSEKARTEQVIADYQAEQKRIANKQSNPNLKTSIRSIFGTWGFVTLNSGNNAGIVNGSMLDVIRDGEVIAKLQVETVEATSAAADIVPDSLKPETVLMVGDRVVAAKPAEPAPAKPVKPATPAQPAGGAAQPAGEAAQPAGDAAQPAGEPAADPFTTPEPAPSTEPATEPAPSTEPATTPATGDAPAADTPPAEGEKDPFATGQ